MQSPYSPSPSATPGSRQPKHAFSVGQVRRFTPSDIEEHLSEAIAALLYENISSSAHDCLHTELPPSADKSGAIQDVSDTLLPVTVSMLEAIMDGDQVAYIDCLPLSSVGPESQADEFAQCRKAWRRELTTGLTAQGLERVTTQFCHMSDVQAMIVGRCRQLSRKARAQIREQIRTRRKQPADSSIAPPSSNEMLLVNAKRIMITQEDTIASGGHPVTQVFRYLSAVDLGVHPNFLGEPLPRYSKLSELDLRDLHEMRAVDAADFKAAPQLKMLAIRFSDILQRVHGLGHCLGLEVLNLSHNPKLRALEAHQTPPKLRLINLHGSCEDARDEKDDLQILPSVRNLQGLRDLHSINVPRVQYIYCGPNTTNAEGATLARGKSVAAEEKYGSIQITDAELNTFEHISPKELVPKEFAQHARRRNVMTLWPTDTDARKYDPHMHVATVLHVAVTAAQTAMYQLGKVPKNVPELPLPMTEAGANLGDASLLPYVLHDALQRLRGLPEIPPGGSALFAQLVDYQELARRYTS